jgi:hypothetical protein
LAKVDYLVVAAGGGGGNVNSIYITGGGGAGGYRESSCELHQVVIQDSPLGMCNFFTQFQFNSISNYNWCRWCRNSSSNESRTWSSIRIQIQSFSTITSTGGGGAGEALIQILAYGARWRFRWWS